MALTTVQGELLESGSALENIGAGNITPSYLSTQAQYTGFKNRIINGAMMIDQRNAGASVTVNSGTPAYTLDRFAAQAINSFGVFTVQQDSSAPVGFVNSLKVTVTTTDASPSTRYRIYQNIEGTNTSDFGWGTANATTVTLSFWVRSSVTGTFGGALQNSASNRSYPFSYTISATDTWEQKSITIVGDTTGTWLTTTSTGVGVTFSLGANASLSGTANVWAGADYRSATGATNLMATNGATFYITGVQLEKGSTATSFDCRPYGTEFDLCRRYAEVYSGGTNEEGSIPQYFAQVDSANRPEIMITYYPKRTGPTFTLSGNFAWNSAANTGIAATYAGAYVGTFTRGTNLFFGVASGVSTNSLSGVGMILFGASGGGKIIINAEL